MGIFLSMLEGFAEGAEEGIYVVKANERARLGEMVEKEQIKCECEEDEEVIRELEYAMGRYDADEDDIYCLCKAIVRQNFMLMRKIEKLTDEVEKLKTEKQ